MHITTSKETELRSAHPLILTLDTHGIPHRWIT